eukprot:732885-Pelagomonas_calceolata.AAC.3
MFGMLRKCKDTCRRNEELSETGWGGCLWGRPGSQWTNMVFFALSLSPAPEGHTRPIALADMLRRCLPTLGPVCQHPRHTWLGGVRRACTGCSLVACRAGYRHQHWPQAQSKASEPACQRNHSGAGTSLWILA